MHFSQPQVISYLSSVYRRIIEERLENEHHFLRTESTREGGEIPKGGQYTVQSFQGFCSSGAKSRGILLEGDENFLKGRNPYDTGITYKSLPFTFYYNQAFD